MPGVRTKNQPASSSACWPYPQSQEPLLRAQYQNILTSRLITFIIFSERCHSAPVPSLHGSSHTSSDKIGAYLINSGAHHCVVWASDGCLYQDSATDFSRSTDNTHPLLGPSI
ncbi:hypothetical protein HETIRDRAFT_173543 [Heterobasidion irregulare TC 32-1]|uniref:Uncharacterized protein n=1 Tax=Heterobasidion irregulare (strain TC 32-1) TaxID=747525 RepID=W4K938_HETIT|nr:uncharacterized protein HETIRDRAFT_173543 [Heterobasidion irregulare TC 32-1]ETW81860.1 hypothetical protein HETIRDRAFT_173543 [Heterobasidion irregulare TC 32-1]